MAREALGLTRGAVDGAARPDRGERGDRVERARALAAGLLRLRACVDAETLA